MVTVRQNEEKIKTSRNLTLIVIFTCMIYLVFLTPYLIAGIIKFISPTFYDISVILLAISHGINFFVYLKFNKLFRKTLINYFRKISYFVFRKYNF